MLGKRFQKRRMNKSYRQCIVMIPAGPSTRMDFVEDTVESINFHIGSSAVCTVIIDDSRTRGFFPLADKYENVQVLEAVIYDEGFADMSQSGSLFGKQLKALEEVQKRFRFDVLLKADTDSLVIGNGVQQDVLRFLSSHPDVGIVGAYTHRGDGSPKDHAMALKGRQLTHEITFPRCLRNLSLAKALRGLVRRAEENGYARGATCTGGGYFMAARLVDTMEQNGFLRLQILRHSKLSEDTLMGLLAYACGFRLSDMPVNSDVLAINHTGLPMPVEELVARGKKLLHPVKGEDPSNGGKSAGVLPEAARDPCLIALGAELLRRIDSSQTRFVVNQNNTSIKFGIAIPTHNQAVYIGDALRSAFAQTIPPCQVLVSDDAGTDDTKAVVEAFRKTLPLEEQNRLRYDRSPQQLGIGGNFDRAARMAQGDFVVKLDSDDILEPQFIEILSEHLKKNPQAGWAHCNVLNIHPEGSPIGLAHSRKKTGFYSAMELLPTYFRHNDTCHCVLIRKSAYEVVGGYRPEMKTCEDWLLWLEMILGGWGHCFDERPLAKMRKYEARPELMSRRRLDFVDSVKFMLPRIESLCRKKPAALNTSVDEAVEELHKAVAKLCVSSGCDEKDVHVRKTLFAAAYEIHPSIKNRLWLKAGCPLPTEGTRLAGSLSGLPRRIARAIWQRMRQHA